MFRHKLCSVLPNIWKRKTIEEYFTNKLYLKFFKIYLCDVLYSVSTITQIQFIHINDYCKNSLRKIFINRTSNEFHNFLLQ